MHPSLPDDVVGRCRRLRSDAWRYFRGSGLAGIVPQAGWGAKSGGWCRVRGLNPRPSVYKFDMKLLFSAKKSLYYPVWLHVGCEGRMATSFQKRKRKGGFRYTATVRRGEVTISATFDLKDSAKRWAEGCERAIENAHARRVQFDRQEWVLRGRKRTLKPGDELLPKPPTQEEIDAQPHPRPDWSLRKALDHYDQHITEHRKGWRQERARIAMWKACEITSPDGKVVRIADKRLGDVTKADMVAWMKSRKNLKGTAAGRKCAASTIRNDLSRISALYALAATPADEQFDELWGWGLTTLANPVTGVPLPKLPEGRDRRLGTVRRDGKLKKEEDLITEALLEGLDGLQMVAFLSVALATGMRRSEILDIRVGQCVHTEDGPECWRPTSKNGAPRRVLLTRRADAALHQRIAELHCPAPDAKVFSLNGDAVASRWDRAMERAGIIDLHVHDLRHEALSRVAARGFTIPELKRQSGHKSDAALMRYVNAKSSEMRRKLEDSEEAPKIVKAA